MGATGARQDPGKVWKGKKMPGHMGHKPAFARNIIVMKVDSRYDVLALRGCVPGGKGTWLRIQDAFFKPHLTPPPFPTYFPKVNEPGQTITAKLPVPLSWGETDLSLDSTTIESVFPDEEMEDEEDVPKETKEARREEKRLKSRKGMRLKVKKLEKKARAAESGLPPGAK